jgi:hypothetical protein
MKVPKPTLELSLQTKESPRDVLLRSATLRGDTIPIKQIGNTTLDLTEGARACDGFARLPGIKIYFLPADKICFDLC